MLKLFSILFILVKPILVLSQSDTIINDRRFEILERFPNGKIKNIGQFDTDCLGQKNRKHGIFISYNDLGEKSKVRVFFYDEPRNRKILGLKHGWWGFYLHNFKYFMGIKIRHRIVDPCF